MSIPLISITIGMDPDILTLGGLQLTWHGLFTFIAVAVAVFLVARWSKREGIDTDSVYSVAVWAILGGIIFSRITHVIDRFNDIYRHDIFRAFEVWEGGVTIYGAILGGFLGGSAYLLIRNNPSFMRKWNKVFPFAPLETAPLPSIGRLADITAPAILIAMALGRIGDIINGEHVANLTQYPWGFVYSHLESPSNSQHGLAASHPAVVYELLWDLIVLGAVWWLRNRIRPYGMLFALYLAMYSVGKFFISFLRIGEGATETFMDKEWVLSMGEAHFISLAVLVVAVPILLSKAQLIKPTRVSRPPKARVRGGN